MPLSCEKLRAPQDLSLYVRIPHGNFPVSVLAPCYRSAPTEHILYSAFTAGDMPAGNGGQFVRGHSSTRDTGLGHCRRALHLRSAEQSGPQCAPQCAGPTTFPSKYSPALDYSRTTSYTSNITFYGQIQSSPG